MDGEYLPDIDTPCYVVDEAAIEANLQRLDDVQRRTGCRIILALKGFAMFRVFPLVRRYLCGVTASSLHEARLGFEEFGGEVHLCAPAYREDEWDELMRYADHVSFNSLNQWRRFGPRVPPSQGVSCGLRVNPEHSEVKVPLYDPCAPGSRLGVTAAALEGANLAGLEGLHFHTLCELNSDSLERTLAAFERRFGKWVADMKWVNFGGGHHITRRDYDVDRLCRIVGAFQEKHPDTQVYLEPGEAVALHAGVLISTVLDVVHNVRPIAILDTSAAAHMPDVLEMPYRPRIEGAGEPGEYAHTYRLGGVSCLAGDVIGDYSFPAPLRVGDRLVFHDMAHYTMVKNNTFNGIRLPTIALRRTDGVVEMVRRFTYEDYRNRLS